jgi:predicted DNA-binding antitoxin AbrB/MazE fold protein
VITKAIYENGALHPLEPLSLTEGEQVEVIVRTPEVAVPEAAWTAELAWQAMKEVQELAGEARSDDPHAARDHDHYLYGARRRT